MINYLGDNISLITDTKPFPLPPPVFAFSSAGSPLLKY